MAIVPVMVREIFTWNRSKMNLNTKSQDTKRLPQYERTIVTDYSNIRSY